MKNVSGKPTRSRPTARAALRRKVRDAFLLTGEDPVSAAKHLAQMAAHRRNRPGFVAIGETVENLAMLLDEQRNVSGILLQGEMADAVEMDLGLADYLPDVFMPADPGDGVMEFLIAGVELGRRRGTLLALDNIVQLAQRRRVDEADRLGN